MRTIHVQTINRKSNCPKTKIFASSCLIGHCVRRSHSERGKQINVVNKSTFILGAQIKTCSSNLKQRKTHSFVSIKLSFSTLAKIKHIQVFLMPKVVWTNSLIINPKF